MNKPRTDCMAGSCRITAKGAFLSVFLSPISIFIDACDPACCRTDIHHAPRCCQPKANDAEFDQ